MTVVIFIFPKNQPSGQYGVQKTQKMKSVGFPRVQKVYLCTSKGFKSIIIVIGVLDQARKSSKLNFRSTKIFGRKSAPCIQYRAKSSFRRFHYSPQVSPLFLFALTMPYQLSFILKQKNRWGSGGQKPEMTKNRKFSRFSVKNHKISSFFEFLFSPSS